MNDCAKKGFVLAGSRMLGQRSITVQSGMTTLNQSKTFGFTLHGSRMFGRMSTSARSGMTTLNQSKTFGFTLIELLVVIAIVALLSSVVLAALSTARAKARDGRRVATARSLKQALVMWEDRNGSIIGINSGARGSMMALSATTSKSIIDVLVQDEVLQRKVASDSVFGANTYFLGVCADGRYDVYSKLERAESAQSSSTLSSGCDGSGALAAGYNYSSGAGGGAGAAGVVAGVGGGGGGSCVLDPHCDKVVLLMHMTGAVNSTVFPDVKGNAIVVSGNTKIAATSLLFGANTATFDGVGDFLTLPTSASLDMGTGDYTVEAWVYNKGNGSSNGALIGNNSTGLNALFTAGMANAYQSPSGSTYNCAYSQNAWHHLAYAKTGGYIKAFVDGTQCHNWAESRSADISTSLIGRAPGAPGVYDHNGYIAELRITKGVARYTSNFTAPSTAFPDN